jgi:peptidoglycan/LPS O-acetylase OafA/YrhL
VKVFEEVDEPLAHRVDIASSDTHRERFAHLYGLRGLAILAVVLAEVVRYAPGLPFRYPAELSVARAGVHGLDLFFVISGFGLAYPALAVMRQDGKAYLDVARYAVKRIFRIMPAYWVALALTVLVPLLASYYGIFSVAGFGTPHPLSSFLHQAFFAGNDAGNDGFWTLGVTARWYLVFPLLLGLWVRAPRWFAMLAVTLTAADLLTPAHSIGVGALVACMLGIVAADLRVANPSWARFAFIFAIVAAGCASLLEQVVAALPGPLVAGTIYPSNPLWQVAAGAWLVAVGRSRLLDRAFSLPLLGVCGAASFSISLVVAPLVVFIFHQASGRQSAVNAALAAYAAALIVGFILWQVVDRWFAGTSLRQAIADKAAPLIWRVLAAIRCERVEIVEVVAAARLDLATAVNGAHVPSSFYAPPPRPDAGNLATVMRRSGSPEDLAAEILQAKKRLAERSIELLGDRLEASPAEPDRSEPAGFYDKTNRTNEAPAAPALAAVPSAPAPPATDRAPSRIHIRAISPAKPAVPPPTEPASAPAAAAEPPTPAFAESGEHRVRFTLRPVRPAPVRISATTHVPLPFSFSANGERARADGG